MEQRTISAQEATKILVTEEGHYADVKRIEIKPSKLSETISAFANTSGGEIFVGIAETKQRIRKVREWEGFKDLEAANAHIQVIEGLAALGNHYRATVLNCSGKSGYVLHLTIFKTNDILNATNGVPYVRRNAQSLPVDTEDKLKSLKLNKGVVSFEDEPLNIAQKYVTESRVTIEFLKNIVPNAEPAEWLASQFLLTGGEAHSRCNASLCGSAAGCARQAISS